MFKNINGSIFAIEMRQKEPLVFEKAVKIVFKKM